LIQELKAKRKQKMEKGEELFQKRNQLHAKKSGYSIKI
jgi:hypothetical protein